MQMMTVEAKIYDINGKKKKLNVQLKKVQNPIKKKRLMIEIKNCEQQLVGFSKLGGLLIESSGSDTLSSI